MISALVPLSCSDPAVALLRLLLATEGQPLALETCCQQLGCAREELPAAVQALRAHGAEVSLLPGLGVSATRSGRLSAPEFLALRPPGSWPPAALCLAETHSTQEVTAHWAAHGFASGLLVTADFQTQGRGRHRRRWFSEPGKNLLCSMLLTDDQLHPLPALRVALAVHRALSAWVGEELQLRWPNDVVIRGRKLAGILIEPLPPGAIVGVGINVNQSMQAVPGQLARPATSLADQLGHPVERLALLSALADAIQELCVTHAPSADAVLAQYRGHCATLGRRLTVATRAGRVVGRALDVGCNGELLVAGDDGTPPRRVFSGDVVETRQDLDPAETPES